jgi:O-antigen/teichoic acid export membrane protein
MQQTIRNRLKPLLDRFTSNELLRRILKNTGYLFGATAISAALSMVQGILAARLLGVALFGVLGAITLFASVINKFLSFRMSEFVVKYVGAYSEAGDQERAAAIFKVAALAEMTVSILAFVLIWLLAPFGARYFAKDPSLSIWFAIYGIIVIVNLIAESSTGLLQIFNRFRIIAIANLLSNLAILIWTAVVYVRQGGIQGILIAYIIGKAVYAFSLTGAALVEAARRWGGGWWRVRLELLRYKARELTYFAVSTNLSGTLSTINKDSEILWVSYFRSNQETGYYKLALSLANLVQMPISPLPQVTYPELSRQVARKDWKGMRQILRQGSLLAGGYSLAASLFLAIFGLPLIRYIYTPEFAPAYQALLILLIGYLVANTFFWARPALLALGLPQFALRVNITVTVIKVVGLLIFLPRYGYLVSAAMLAFSYVLGVLVSAIRAVIEIRRRAGPSDAAAAISLPQGEE